MEQYSSIERNVSFIQYVLNDRRSIEYLFEGLKIEVPFNTLNRDTVEAVLVLIDKLPKFVKYVSLVEQIIEVTKAVMSDKESFQHLVKGAKESVEPIQGKINVGISIIEEAKKRAEQDNAKVTVYSLIKLLKDPAVQQVVHFVKALLSVMSERDWKNKS